ncbi:NAD(P)-binding domain-containing protein [Nocardiopsis suaedae]|uniref:NAD(P)-binding domain-containing protein n=1 Tax=Nocardiopsis suaedae TaxID=3018444 RepID=A0ABT4TIU8_9ACTN|nr:NAD(P)-binding domain-containing protein [Nocardiopsis suaedae]MDA2804291.1 NAD(P)-binding domain-containing protein [Nocardiopsis suaedae]
MISTDARDEERFRVAVIGAGHLGEAVLGGLLRAGLPARDVAVSTLPAEWAHTLAGRHGVAAGTDNAAAADGADIALVAVPPSAVPAAAAEVGSALPAGRSRCRWRPRCRSRGSRRRWAPGVRPRGP